MFSTKESPPRGRENPPITRDDIESWAALIEPPTPEELALFDKIKAY